MGSPHRLPPGIRRPVQPLSHPVPLQLGRSRLRPNQDPRLGRHPDNPHHDHGSVAAVSVLVGWLAAVSVPVGWSGAVSTPSA